MECMATTERTWEVDPLALKAACELLDVKAPVEVKRTGQVRTGGKHGFRDGKHVLKISTYATDHGASVFLWHELAHASQQERLGVDRKKWLEVYWASVKRYGYKNSPFEVEARAASEFAEDHPLVRRAGSVRLKSDSPAWWSS